MIIKANLLYKPGNFQMDDCQIEKVVELSREEFGRLKLTPLADQPFIRENRGCMFSRDGVMHCLLTLEQGGNDGVLIEAEGHDYARYAAYIPGVRHILNAGMGYSWPDLRVRDILPLLNSRPIFLCHEEAEQSVLAKSLRRLTGAGQEECAALLNARVSKICETPEGTEVVLTGVDPEELVRFNEAFDAFLEAEQAMGPVM